MGCCESRQLDRKEMELIMSQGSFASPKTLSSHEFKDVSLESLRQSPLGARVECPFPLHSDPAQSFHYFFEARDRFLKPESSIDCSKDDTTVSRQFIRTLNVSQEDCSQTWKLRLETSLADQQYVSLCRNNPHCGDVWLSPPRTSPDLETSGLSSISLDQGVGELSLLDLVDMETGLRQIEESEN